MYYKKYNKEQKGFTLLELMLVVAMIGLVAMFSVTVSSSFLWRTDLSFAQYTSVVGLRRAQVLARAQAYDSDWGVHITDNQMTIFKGNDFISRDALYDEEYDLGSVLVLVPVSVVYHKFSGKPYDNLSEINLITGQDTVAITVNSEGTINY